MTRDVRLIDADKLAEHITDMSTDYWTTNYGIPVSALEDAPTVEAIPISFIEEQIKECEKYDYPNTAKIFTALIKMWDNVKAEWERKEE